MIRPPPPNLYACKAAEEEAPGHQAQGGFLRYGGAGLIDYIIDYMHIDYMDYTTTLPLGYQQDDVPSSGLFVPSSLTINTAERRRVESTFHSQVNKYFA